MSTAAFGGAIHSVSFYTSLENDNNNDKTNKYCFFFSIGMVKLSNSILYSI